MLRVPFLQMALIVMVVAGCNQDQGGVSQEARSPEIDLTQKAVLFDGPPIIKQISDEFVSVELTVRNDSIVAVCLSGVSGEQTFYHQSELLTDGFRTQTYSPQLLQLAPTEAATLTIKAELYDMFVFGDGAVQNYGYQPRYRDVVSGKITNPSVPLDIFDNTYGKDLQLKFSLGFFICSPRSATFIVESLPTEKFRLSLPFGE